RRMVTVSPGFAIVKGIIRAHLPSAFACANSVYAVSLRLLTAKVNRFWSGKAKFVTINKL
ncbi:MAG TPA: hypothetical protein H9890_09245, partial [Candidatus Faecalibacterium intestinigallinarum]|nr:hypothetical protein [Candidatus Faecalibacterium intestinigallinarum]